MKISTLIQALDLIGQIYRNKTGSGPADAIRKVRQQLEGAGDATLAEWADAKRAPGKVAAKKTAAKAKPDGEQLAQAQRRLEQAASHTELAAAIAGLKLSAAAWQALARDLTGLSARSGKLAREAVERHFSDRLLLDARVESVKRTFA